ncbi:disease resistance protein RPV1-like [Mercurialis annua]|uniref:disease resistance protein RPV1-like n=1 Tax=Mercurialis annua TaxID=3986 RepID=UPI0024ADC046|nr:disease resistance protein RPV1-like [Mercurialis annua]
MASTSSYKTSYDVFLSFRGPDTRDNFTSHLHQKLVDKNIQTFIDNRLDRGEEIESSLTDVIEESQISVVVFSEGYASSPWCLDELVKIMECRKKLGRIVLPIFYHVDPTDVEQQTGIFGDGFRKLESKNKNNMGTWIDSLKEATTLSGWDSKNHRPDSELIETVVKEIVKKLSPTSFSISVDLVGIDSPIEQILSLLCTGPDDEPHFVGIWGMGGIGKTTIAEAVFSVTSAQFDSCCFLSNVREQSKFGLIQLRSILISELLCDENLNIRMLHTLPTFVKVRLKRKKVMIVLDDVSEWAQLDGLIGDKSWLSPGSRVIVTSRDKEVLQFCHELYKVDELQDSDALRLFSTYAFKQNNHSEDYSELATKVMKYAQGVPLALKLLGSHLCKRSLKEWEIVLNKLKYSPYSKIQEILEISYAELEPEVKDIFLDIACFFKGQRRDQVREILENGYRNFCWGIMRLNDKCLLTIKEHIGILVMHDLVKEMGIEIARREGSRLGNSKDISRLLTNSIGKEEIQGIFVDMSELEVVHLHPKAFSEMSNLRLLKFYRHNNVSQWDRKAVFMLESGQSEYLKCLPSMLSFLHWEEYPYKSLPTNFCMENLVELNLRRSNITHLWDGDHMCPRNLKRLDLFDCQQLMRLPNLSLAKNLEDIDLSNCELLVEIDSLGYLCNLTRLNLHYCTKLKRLPEIPSCIKYLDISGSGVEELSPSTQFLENHQCFDMKNCIYLESCVDLRLSYCQNLRKFPEIIGSVRSFYMYNAAVDKMPSIISSSLVHLLTTKCKSLAIIPDSISELKCLKELSLSGCPILAKLPPLCGLDSLETLHLANTAVVEIPDDIVSLPSLKVLYLRNCSRLQGLPKLPQRLRILTVENCLSLKTTESSSYISSIEFSGDYKFRFNYGNCLNLDNISRCNILSNAWFYFKEMANAISDTRNKHEGWYTVCLPGSEIPGWYSYQSQVSPVAIEFPSFYFNTLLLGFAFALVLKFNSSEDHTGLSVRVECHFKNATSEKHTSFTSFMGYFAVSESDHVFLWYDPNFYYGLKDWLIENRCSVNEASFEFSAFNKMFREMRELEVKKCGVHLIW